MSPIYRQSHQVKKNFATPPVGHSKRREHSERRRLLPLAITIGDPTGIGTELVAAWLSTYCNQSQSHLSIRVYGDISALKRVSKAFEWSLPEASAQVEYCEIEGELPGQIAHQAIVQAVADIAAGKARGLVTGPISKANCWQAGVRYPGHTEMLADLANQYWANKHFSPEATYQSDMLFEHDGLRVLLLTRHIPLREVSDQLTISGVVASLESLIGYLQKVAGIKTPRIALLGVNPHAGEIGGHEEAHILMPAREQVMARHDVYISTPMAADGVFRGMNPQAPEYHAYVAPSHDQGLIPMKLLAGYAAVNVTIGLPFVRTSVSHGVAMDKVGTGRADMTGLVAAIQLADKLTMSGTARSFSNNQQNTEATGMNSLVTSVN